MQATDVYVARARWSQRGTWNAERIVAALQDWAALVGSPPRAYDWAPASAANRGLDSAHARLWAQQYPRWPSATTVAAYFGGWSAALRAAGLHPNREIASGVGREERILAAQRMAKAGVSVATIAGVLDIAPRTVRGYLRAGSCADCGTPVVTAALCPRCAARRTTRPRMTRAEVLAAIREWVEVTGEPPRVEEWTPSADPQQRWAREYPRWPSFMTVRTHFGTWPAALRAAGCTPPRVRWDREAIVRALQRLADERGGAPAQRSLGGPGLPSPHTVRRHFGSYAGALLAAGLRPARRTWKREEILGAIAEFERRFGRPPAPSDWSRACAEHPHASSVRRRFGSWSAAMEARAGHEPPSASAAASSARDRIPSLR